MNGIWMRLALIAAVTAVFGIAQIDQLFATILAFAVSKGTAALIGFVVIAFFAWRIVEKRELPARYQSPNYVIIGLSVASVTLLAGPYVYAVFGLRIGLLLRFLNEPVVQTLATIGLLALLLKMSTELRPQFESEQREDGLTRILILGLTAFIGATFMFIPTTWLPPVDWAALMGGRLNDAVSSWPAWVQWILALGVDTGSW